MQMSSTRPGLTGYVSDNRFRLTLLACALVLAAMLAGGLRHRSIHPDLGRRRRRCRGIVELRS